MLSRNSQKCCSCRFSSFSQCEGEQYWCFVWNVVLFIFLHKTSGLELFFGGHSVSLRNNQLKWPETGSNIYIYRLFPTWAQQWAGVGRYTLKAQLSFRHYYRARWLTWKKAVNDWLIACFVAHHKSRGEIARSFARSLARKFSYRAARQNTLNIAFYAIFLQPHPFRSQFCSV